jgi:hypothetical protein
MGIPGLLLSETWESANPIDALSSCAEVVAAIEVLRLLFALTCWTG